MGQAHFKSIRNRLQDPEARVLLAGFDLRQVASIDPEHLGHLNLGPAPFTPQGPNAISKSYSNVSGHSQIIACTLLLACWPLPTSRSGRGLT